MVTAATKAEQTNDPNNHESKRYRTFIFVFANVILHEIGHLLLTFLTKGRTDSPLRTTSRILG